MIARYTRAEMGRIFSDENRFAQWLEVELAATESLAELGVVPADAAIALLKDKPKPTDQDIDEGMAANICRCGTYQRIRAAIKAAAGESA